MKVILKGLPTSSGRVRGKARVILPPIEGKRLEPGEILVTIITDPSMVVDIIENASAIVTDRGGMISHPAIIARELGIPCVVKTQSATKIIRTGMEIIVDGSKGVIYEPS